MGHRDIWGKDSKKWLKQCPCFDAEKEYEHLDDLIKKSKSEPAQPEKYVIDKPTDYTGFLKKLRQW